jgi:hypothetical protein
MHERNVYQRVQLGKQAQLGKFGDTGDEDEFKKLMAEFDLGVETRHNMSHLGKQKLIVSQLVSLDKFDDGGIILVNQKNDFFSLRLVDVLYQEKEGICRIIVSK